LFAWQDPDKATCRKPKELPQLTYILAHCHAATPFWLSARMQERAVGAKVVVKGLVAEVFCDSHLLPVFLFAGFNILSNEHRTVTTSAQSTKLCIRLHTVAEGLPIS
jgi:hypothetical protein